MNVDQSVAEYVGVDEDIDVHEPPEEVQTEEGSNSEGGSGDEDDDPPVSVSTALAYCVELSSFLFHCKAGAGYGADVDKTHKISSRTTKATDITTQLLPTSRINVAISLSDGFYN
ncbi:hypothetical protein AM587_10000676 [Phytophthora nicotianae]|uniref:Uncharacterized protein n=1 Tax=Phytophthora nicotianae TaxID=4792 RepID=A0A0W8BVN8_PHYNI|nr:hypothetical protein AM587_10000676 [Phytophthora nicotianae]